MIIPTGVGASQGGYGGDATVWMSLLASVSDTLLTHPNVANAAAFQRLPENALYVEGYGLDQFFKGEWVLRRVRKNRVGVVFDRGIPEDMRILHRNVMNAVRTVYGIDILGEVLTDAPLQLHCKTTPTGASSGGLDNPDVLLSACQTLVVQGATAIALCGYFSGLSDHADEAAYRAGSGVDPIGGLEGILSHWVVSEFQIPCAHAPVFSWEDAQPQRDEVVDPRAASEFITPTFLPCVLTGLARAPQFAHGTEAQPGDLSVSQLDALVVPVDCLGSVPVLACLARGIPVLTVAENTTVLNITAETLLGEPKAQALEAQGLLLPVRSYAEAAGVLQLMRLGHSLPRRHTMSGNALRAEETV